MDNGQLRTTNQATRLMAIGTGLGWVNVVVALGAVIASLATGRIGEATIFNADTFQLALLWRELGRHGTLAGWDLPINPPLFPDGLLFGPLWWLLPNPYLANIGYGVGQILLFLGGLLALVRQLFGQTQRTRQWLLLATTLVLLLFATGRYFVLTFIFLSVHHFGVLLVLPWLLALLLQLWGPATSRAARIGRASGLAGITLLTAFSDALFVVQVTLPLAITLALVAWLQPNWRRLSLQLSGLLIGLTGIGQLGRLWVLTPGKLNDYYQPVTPAHAWLAQTLHQEPLFSGYWLTALGALMLLLFLIGLDHRRNSAQPAGCTQPAAEPVAVNAAGLALVVTYLFLTAGISALAPLLAGNFFAAEHTRYLLPPIYLPLFLGWPLLLAYWPLRPGLSPASNARGLSRLAFNLLSAPAGFSLLCGVLLLYQMLTLKFGALTRLAAWEDGTARCLTQAVQTVGVHKGMANFWQANTLPLLVQGVDLVQVYPDLSIYYYNNNLRWYDETVDFALIDTAAVPDYRLDEAAIMRQFGSPATTFQCWASKGLVYNRPADLPFQRHLQTQPVRARFDHPSARFTFYGSALPSLIGGLGIGLSKAASAVWGNRSGELGLIRLAQLPAATYRLAIHTFADSPNTGGWQVSTQQGAGSTVLTQGTLAASGRQVSLGSFTLATTSDVVLTVLYQQGTLYLDKVDLQRAGAAVVATPTPTGLGQFTLIYPRPGSFLVQPQADFVWQWTGAPPAPEQAFEVRIWHAADPYHYGAHDAAAGRADLRQIDDTYTLHLDLGGAYALQQSGRGQYSWSVAVVNVTPNYQDLQIEAPPSIFFWEPE